MHERITFRPGQQDYSTLVQDDLIDLMPPSDQKEVSDEFKDAAHEVTARHHLAESEQSEKDGGTTKGGEGQNQEFQDSMSEITTRQNDLGLLAKADDLSDLMQLPNDQAGNLNLPYEIDELSDLMPFTNDDPNNSNMPHEKDYPSDLMPPAKAEIEEASRPNPPSQSRPRGYGL